MEEPEIRDKCSKKSLEYHQLCIITYTCNLLQNKGGIMFIVVEGDNGVGKTTLGHYLQNEGFEFISVLPEIKNLEEAAKKNEVGSEKRFNAFLEYNRACAELARVYPDSVVVRYWVSSVAAAYADCLLSLDEAVLKAQECLTSFSQPDIFFRLKCPRKERVTRIIQRNNEGNFSDNTSFDRENRYSDILDVIGNDCVHFVNIDTVDNDVDGVANIVRNTIEKFKDGRY